MLGRISIADAILTGAAVLLAAASPNLFVASQAGIAKLSVLGRFVLVPSVIGIAFIYLVARARSPRVAHNLLFGALMGVAGTLGLEVVREIGFRLGGMPGDMPKLLGVQLLDRFMQGPSAASNLAGWSYHFWNGASFGIIAALFVGRMRFWMGPAYGVLIAIGFMAGPAAQGLGVGRFGVDFGPSFAATVLLAHLAYGSILGALSSRWIQGKGLVPALLSRRPSATDLSSPAGERLNVVERY